MERRKRIPVSAHHNTCVGAFVMSDTTTLRRESVTRTSVLFTSNTQEQQDQRRNACGVSLELCSPCDVLDKRRRGKTRLGRGRVECLQWRMCPPQSRTSSLKFQRVWARPSGGSQPRKKRHFPIEETDVNKNMRTLPSH